jgi:hypothetical protein
VGEDLQQVEFERALFRTVSGMCALPGFTQLLCFRFIRRERVHQRGIADAKLQRYSIHEIRPAVPEGTRVKVDILANTDLRVEPSRALHTFTTQDAGAGNQQGAAEHHACGEGPFGAESTAQQRAPRRIVEELAFVAQLRFRSIAEGFDSTEHDTDFGVLEEYLLYGSIVPFGDNVVVIQEMYESSPRKRPTQVPNGAWHASGRHRIFQVSHPGIADALNDLLSGRFRTVIDNDNLDQHACLVENTGDGLAKLLRASKCRDDD